MELEWNTKMNSHGKIVKKSGKKHVIYKCSKTYGNKEFWSVNSKDLKNFFRISQKY